MNTQGKLTGTAKFHFHGHVVNHGDSLEITVDIDDMSTTKMWVNNEVVVDNIEGEYTFILKANDRIRITTRHGETLAEVCYIEGETAILHNILFYGAYHAFGASAVGWIETSRLRGNIQTSAAEGFVSLSLYRTARNMARLTAGKPYSARIYDALLWLTSNGAKATYPVTDQISRSELAEMEQYLGPSTISQLTTVGEDDDADPYADYDMEDSADYVSDYVDSD